MRRNTVRILKYALVVGVVLLFAPTVIRLLQSRDEERDALQNAARGLPVEPASDTGGATGKSKLCALLCMVLARILLHLQVACIFWRTWTIGMRPLFTHRQYCVTSIL